MGADLSHSMNHTQSLIVFPSRITTAFTGLRPVEDRKTENPPAATPVQRFVSHMFRCACKEFEALVPSRRAIRNRPKTLETFPFVKMLNHRNFSGAG
jgi:hypothetical protein